MTHWAEGDPVVSVIIPVLNEERHIADCLRAVLSQTWPRSRMEVVVVDGGSSDATRQRAAESLADAGLARWEVVLNESSATPSNLNRGLEWAEGDLVARVDARSRIPPDYMERCAEVLLTRPEIVVVGGAQLAKAPADSGAIGRGIARAQRNPWGMGLARYRRRSRSGPADTVYLGFFRRGDLVQAGGWDERFATNQDFELNRRLGRAGVVWFLSGVDVVYIPRGTLGELARQYRRFGRAKAWAWREGDVAILPRQMIQLAVPPVAAVIAAVVAARRPRLAVLLTMAAIAAFDRAGGPAESASERPPSLVASAVMAGSWWLGVVEQATGLVSVGQRAVRGR